MKTAREIQKYYLSFEPQRFDCHERYFLTFQAVYELINGGIQYPVIFDGKIF
jgi:hypothetical protein